MSGDPKDEADQPEADQELTTDPWADAEAAAEAEASAGDEEVAGDGAVEDGAVEDGAVEDGAVEDGALEDGPVEDGDFQESDSDGGDADESDLDEAPAAQAGADTEGADDEFDTDDDDDLGAQTEQDADSDSATDWDEALTAAAGADGAAGDGSADEAWDEAAEGAELPDAEAEEDVASAVEQPGEPVPAAELVPFLEDEQLDANVRSVAALLFASPDPLSENRLRELVEEVGKDEIRAAVGQLQARLEAAGLPFVCRDVAGGWRLFTEPALAEVVQRLAKARKAERISQAALETLAIVSYRQPVTKAEIEAIRGVQAGPMLRTLVDRRLVRVAGRADQPGAPLLYGTTSEFLDRFGLSGLKELPRDAELARD
ncbi:SMC-Scp complex subunit ScpB [Engelhardtia mirabilis]